jgi:PPM family protein phosphatase
VLKASGVTEKGPGRATNQDRFAVDEALGLCVLADGMGGHNAGELAAEIAIQAVLDVVRDPQRVGWPFGIDPSLSETGNLIRTAIHLANMQVVECAGTSSAFAGMGTTVVAAVVRNGRLSVGHVGDSRLYRLTGASLRQLTGDDSWMATVAAHDPRTDAALMQYHPMRHALTKVVGNLRRTDVEVSEESLTHGDRLLLTTDGIHGVLDEPRLSSLLMESDDTAAIVSALVRCAVSRGSRDDCTAIVGRYLTH